MANKKMCNANGGSNIRISTTDGVVYFLNLNMTNERKKKKLGHELLKLLTGINNIEVDGF